MSKRAGSAEEKLRNLSQEKKELLRALQRKGAKDLSRVEPREIDGSLAMSSAQQRLWFIDQLETGSAGYYIPIAMRLRGRLNHGVLRKSLDVIVQRHEVLRTVFENVLGEPRPTIHKSAGFALETTDLMAYGRSEREVEIQRAKREEAQGKFDLSTGPLIRGRLLQLESDEHILLVTMHHIVSDGWSVDIFLSELSALYIANLEGRSDALEPLALQYADYAGWQRSWLRSAQVREQLTYWRENLQGAPVQLDLPTDHLRPKSQSYRGENITFMLSEALASDLRSLAKEHRLTLFMVLYGAFAILMSRLSGSEDVLVGTPIANRRRFEVEGLIGLFANTLTLRTTVREDLLLEEYFETVRRVTLGAYDHQDIPFEQVVEALQPERTLGRHPIFQVMFSLERAQKRELRIPGVTSTLEDGVDEPAKFDLDLWMEERAQGIHGTVNFATDLFDRSTVARWMACYRELLEDMARGNPVRVRDWRMLPAAERDVICSFNETRAPFPSGRLIHEIFERQAEQTPDGIALSFEGSLLSYAELDDRANRLAGFLRRRGVGPDCRVAIFLERSLELVIGLLGVLKAGGAYVPVDPSYPRERIEYMLEDSEPTVVLAQEATRSVLPHTAEAVFIDSQWPAIASEATDSRAQRESGRSPRCLAYVIYTSGSTGRPKGVMNEHRAVVNRLHWMQQQYQLNLADRILQKTPSSFDVSVWEFFWPLLTGARLIIAKPGGHKDPEYLQDVIEAEGVTTLHFVPSMLQGFLDHLQPGRCQSIRRIVCSGEELSAALRQECLTKLPNARLSNLYGPTEAAVDVTSWECTADERGSRVPIGRPISNVQIHILDRRCDLVPIGVVGEVYIGGVGVGRGYLNRPELTADRFVADPFGADSSATLYRTGDLGRWRPDGAIEYFGRNDHQVKVRGHRVELGEIEALLARHQQVKEAAVTATEDSAGTKKLVAYVLPVGDPAVSRDQLRQYLRSALPEHMMPSAIVFLEQWLLTPSGKLDRRALPAPSLAAYATREYERPLGETEGVLAGIWQELLKVEKVGRHDNFFELGGHSLLIVKMLELLRRAGFSTEVRRVFENPILSDLAHALLQAPSSSVVVPPNLIGTECHAITPAMLPLVCLDQAQIDSIVQSSPGGAGNIQDIYPLLPLQEGILFHCLLNEQAGDTYVIPMLLSVASRSKLDLFLHALDKVIERHDVLRTAVMWERLTQPVQVVYRRVTLHLEQVRLDPDADAVEQLKNRMKPELQKIELHRAPLMKALIAADPNGPKWYVLLQWHHLICDHESVETMIAEVVAYLQEGSPELPEALPYRNHVAQALASVKARDAGEFFRGKLGDIEEPTMPFGVIDVRSGGSRMEQAEQAVDRAVARGIRIQARRLGVSAATLFHAAWALVVSHTSGRDDIVFGTVLLGRLQGSAGAQRTLGMFMNTLPLRLPLHDVTTEQLVLRTHQELIELLDHEQASLADAQRASQISGGAPLFSALLNYRHSRVDLVSEFPDESGVKYLAVNSWTNYPMMLSVDDLGEEFVLVADADRRIGAHRVLAYADAALRTLVVALEEAPKGAALELSILPKNYRRQVLQSFNATYDRSSSASSVCTLFEEQVTRTPGECAVRSGDQSISYGDLNRASNRLARYLRARGIGPDHVVGICAERGIRLVTAVLGILKSGAAYLPLDPKYPAERLQYMLQDAAPSVVVTERALLSSLPETKAELLVIDAVSNEFQQQDDDNLPIDTTGVTAKNLAYVIYTSGSTGRPKGVGMSHEGLINLLGWHSRVLPRACAVMQFAPLSFDVAFQEIFSTLCSGGTLVMLEDWIRRDARALVSFLERESVQRVFVPPLMLQVIAEEAAASGRASLSGVEDVVVAGEQLRVTPQIAEFFRRVGTCRLHNHYGPTESHVVTSETLCGDSNEWAMLPTIGRPISNAKIYILDHRLAVVPVGVVGEIYIAGASLARGYLNRPDTTSARFIADPFSPDKAARMYKTGDLGRWRPDGSIEYTGRNDDQVKIRGFRVELGEIEAQLATHELVKEVAVIASGDGRFGRRLIAYVAKRIQRDVSSSELRAHLTALVPEHMIPSTFVVLDRLPRTPSGKLDRRALPPPGLGSRSDVQYEPPRGETETVLAGIWMKLLGVEQVGRTDNIFELGGHSLHGVKLISEVDKLLGVRLAVISIFQYPTIREMAGVVDSLRAATSSTATVPVESIAREFEEGVV